MLASSFIFGGKGFIRLQKTNIKDEYRHIFFLIQYNSAVCRPLLDWQLLTLDTTFRDWWSTKWAEWPFKKKSHRRSLLAPSPSFPLSDFFSLSSFAPHSTIRTPGTGYVLKFSMDATCFRVGRQTITFPSHFCYHISILPFFRYVSGEVFFSFFNPYPRLHNQCFRNFAFETYQGE